MAITWKKLAYNDEVGRSATFTVAANDATALEKAQADYLCDGTDDHVQIQAAIDALPATGGEVHLSSGTFNVESSIVLDSYQTLRGCGWNTILTTAGAISLVTAIGSGGSEKVGITVRDLQLDGNGVSDIGIEFDYTDYSLVQNIYSKDHYGGSILAGIVLSNADHNRVVNCHCLGNLAGIEISTGTYNIIANNSCVGNDNGIWIYDAEYNIVSGNSCSGNNHHGIKSEISNHNIITGNSFAGDGQGTTNTYDEIYLDISDYNFIHGNVCRSLGGAAVPRYGINISGATCDGNKVINNDLYDDGFGTAPYNDAGTGTIYVEPGIDDTPVNGELAQPISSNWAFDHKADISAHHVKYTDAEAVTAVEAAGLAFVENKGIILDPALSADGKWSGIAEAGTAGAALVFGDLCYFQTADSKWELANADNGAVGHNLKLGICVAAAAEDAATTILLFGKVRADAVFPALTIGAPVYMAVVAGDIQVAAPSGTTDIVRIVGYGNTADELYFCPENDWIKLV